MAGRPSANMVAAMRLVLAGVVPYTASLRVGLTPTTMYKSRLYKLWLKGDHAALRREMDVERPVKRVVKLVGKKRFLKPDG